MKSKIFPYYKKLNFPSHFDPFKFKNGKREIITRPEIENNRKTLLSFSLPKNGLGLMSKNEYQPLYLVPKNQCLKILKGSLK